MINLTAIWEFILHLDVYLEELIGATGIFAYLALFVVVFLETAAVVLVFLPSDVLLFSACALASVNHSLSFPVLYLMFLTAALLGDSCNFSIGRRLRGAVRRKKKILFIDSADLDKASRFYQKNGSVTIISARFVPVLRSLAPFVAGVSDRSYRGFLKFNAVGILIWNTVFCSLGYFFGNIPQVQDHFALIVLGITCLTMVTGGISLLLSNTLFKEKKHS